MKEIKKSFILYCDYMETVNELTMEERGALFTAVMQYASGEEIVEMERTVKIVFDIIRRQLDRDSEKYEKTLETKKKAGSIGGKARGRAKSPKDDAEQGERSLSKESRQTQAEDSKSKQTQAEDSRCKQTQAEDSRCKQTQAEDSRCKQMEDDTETVTDTEDENETVDVTETVTVNEAVTETVNDTVCVKGSCAAAASAVQPKPTASRSDKTYYTPKKDYRKKNLRQFDDYVRLTPYEFSMLVRDFGEAAARRMIRIVSDYKGAHATQYDDDYNDFFAVKDWGHERYEKEQWEKKQREAKSIDKQAPASYDTSELEDFWNRQ